MSDSCHCHFFCSFVKQTHPHIETLLRVRSFRFVSSPGLFDSHGFRNIFFCWWTFCSVLNHVCAWLSVGRRSSSLVRSSQDTQDTRFGRRESARKKGIQNPDRKSSLGSSVSRSFAFQKCFGAVRIVRLCWPVV